MASALAVSCLLCHHEAVLGVASLTDDGRDADVRYAVESSGRTRPPTKKASRAADRHGKARLMAKALTVGFACGCRAHVEIGSKKRGEPAGAAWFSWIPFLVPF